MCRRVRDAKSRFHRASFSVDAGGQIVEFSREFDVRKCIRRSDSRLSHLKKREILFIDLGGDPSLANGGEREERFARLDNIARLDLTCDNEASRAGAELSLR